MSYAFLETIQQPLNGTNTKIQVIISSYKTKYNKAKFLT